MAFLLVKAVKQGYQAHKDLNSPNPPEQRYDRHGRPKQPGMIYGLVQNAERSMKGKQTQSQEQGQEPAQAETEGSGSTRDQGEQHSGSDAKIFDDPHAPSYEQDPSAMNEYGDEKRSRGYGKAAEAEDAPPSYDIATSSKPSPEPRSQAPSQSRGLPAGFGSATSSGNSFTSSPPPPNPSFRQGYAARPENQRRGSSSSSSSSASSQEDLAQARGLTKDQYRAMKRQYKFERRQFRREQKDLRRYNREEYRAQKRAMKAQRRAALFGPQTTYI